MTLRRPAARRAVSAVEVGTRPIWRLRLARGAPRYLLYTLSVAGVVVSARLAIAPPPTRVERASPTDHPADLAAEGFACAFARRYLAWSSAEPQAHAAALATLAGHGAEAADLRLPASGEQRVLWAQVVQQRAIDSGEHVYTVAAETDSDGMVYLTVPVARLPDGRLALAGYPAFVGPPAVAPARLDGAAREVAQPALLIVTTRALRNYLAGSADELAADLTPGAHVSLPAQPLTLEAVERLDWAADGHSVLALVRASERRGVQYALGYELDVTESQGRWEVSAVQMDPET